MTTESDEPGERARETFEPGNHISAPLQCIKLDTDGIGGSSQYPFPSLASPVYRALSLQLRERRAFFQLYCNIPICTL